MRRISAVLACCAVSFLFLLPAGAQTFRAGFSKQDITPTKPTPMWGYGARRDALSTGVRDPLYAKALVIDVGSEKLALVGLDLGRAPREDMLVRIREAIRQSCGVGMSMIVGSHTHHGPVIELLDEPGKGRGAFDDAVAYAAELEQKIILAIRQAAADVRPARIGWGAKPVDKNRNRHSKIEPKPVDPELGVIRLDGLDGNPIAVIVNFAAHPTMLAGTLETTVPDRPRLDMREEVFEFRTRMPLGNPLARLLFSRSFFPELVAASMDEDLRNNIIRPRLTVVLINRELALVGGSGEWFSQHSVRLKERGRDVRTFVLSCCNGHHMYFPTIEATAEGGYGADPMVGWVSLGAGEQMMDRALIHIYTMLGKYEFKFPF